jgi:hypothetical protein
MAEIGLEQVVRALRAELESAMREADGESLRFQVKSVDLEFNVGVKKMTEGKGGIKFWVLELGGGGTYSSDSIQTVKLSLEPISAGGGRIRIAKTSEDSPLTGHSEPEGP